MAGLSCSPSKTERGLYLRFIHHTQLQDDHRHRQEEWPRLGCSPVVRGDRQVQALPEAYQTVAKFLRLEPHECCMVACHNFDLDAAKRSGFKTAFVRRPNEWGTAGPPDPEPNPQHDIIANDFPDLARQLGTVIN